MLAGRCWRVGHKIDTPVYPLAYDADITVEAQVVFHLLGPFQLPKRAYLVEDIEPFRTRQLLFSRSVTI